MFSHAPPIGSEKSTMHGGLSTVVRILMRSPGSTLNLSLPKSFIPNPPLSVASANATPVGNPYPIISTQRRGSVTSSPANLASCHRQEFLDFQNAALRRKQVFTP